MVFLPGFKLEMAKTPYSSVFLGLLVFLAVLAVGYLGANPLDAILDTYRHRDFTLTERVLTEFRVVIFYISLLLFPHPSRLNLDHDFPISHSLLDPFTTLLSAGTIVGLVGLAIYLARRERLLSFCILWFFGNLVLESSVIGLELVFEHRNYLPSMLLSVLAVALYCRYIKSIRWGIAVSCMVVIVLSMWTYQRNDLWNDNVALWRDAVQKSPNKARPHYNLGQSLSAQGKYDEAISHYSEALLIKPDGDKIHFARGAAFSKMGNINEAIADYREALLINPVNARARNNLGNAMITKGNFEEAHAHFSVALQATPDDEEVHYNLGNLYKTEGRFDDAAKAYKRALSLQPGLTDAINNLAGIYIIQGDHDKALQMYMNMIDREPDNFVAYYNLACMYARQSKVNESINWLEQAVKRGFNDWDVLKTDKDLENIKDSSYFKALLHRGKARNAQ